MKTLQEIIYDFNKLFELGNSDPKPLKQIVIDHIKEVRKSLATIRYMSEEDETPVIPEQSWNSFSDSTKFSMLMCLANSIESFPGLNL